MEHPDVTHVRFYGGEDNTTGAARRYLADAIADNAPDHALIILGERLTTVSQLRDFLARLDESLT